MKGWVDLGSPIAAWPAIEPTTARSQARHPNRYATGFVTREYWIQRITFAAETNAACSRGSADTHTAWRRMSQYILRSLNGGEGN